MSSAHEEETFRAIYLAQVDDATAGKARVLLGPGGRRRLQPTLVDARNLAADPFFFVKVRVFIKELIVRLKEDSADEAKHKGLV